MRIRPIFGKIKRKLLGVIYIMIPSSIIENFFKNKKHQWVFIIGSTNSGSTLLQDLMATHSEISAMMGEGQYRTKALLRDNDRLFGEKKEQFYLTEKDKKNYLRVYYDWYFETKGDRKILLEKTPANSMRMRWLQQWFSPSKFIIIARSPYGVCEGLLRKTGIDIKYAAKNWNEIYSTILDTLEHIDNYILITYDELTNNTDNTLEKIVKFLNLNKEFENFENRELQIHEQNSKIKNMDYKSIEKLKKEDIEIINSICSQTMKKLGLNIIEK